MHNDAAAMFDDLRRRTREEQTDVARRTQALRVDLPFRYLRQQAHLTAPASEFSLASKALGGAHQVAARLLQRYGIEPSELASRADVNVRWSKAYSAAAERRSCCSTSRMVSRHRWFRRRERTRSGCCATSTGDRACVSFAPPASRIHALPMTSSNC